MSKLLAFDLETFEPQTRRFFLLTSKGTSVYDYDFKLLRRIEGLFGVERVLLAPASGSRPANP